MLRPIPLAFLIVAALLANTASVATEWDYRIGEPAPGFQLKSLV